MNKNVQVLQNIEQILLRPGMWMGPSIGQQQQKQYVYTNGKISREQINISNGFIKIFDEVIVNAFDNSFENNKMKNLYVNIDKEGQIISVQNDGCEISIKKHEKTNKYIPELIFTVLYSSTNYDDTKERMTGGMNGVGVKLTNIFSTEFKILINNEKKEYYQECFNNMQIIKEPLIKNVNDNIDNFIKISFKPDIKRFNMSEIDDNNIAFLQRRTYDIAALLPNINVYYNQQLCFDKHCKNKFLKYVQLYTDSPIYCLQNNKKGQIYIIYNEQFEKCVSFINGINMYNEGTHIDFVYKNICSYLKEKYSKLDDIQNKYIKQKIQIFMYLYIDKPEFDSQAKRELSTQEAKLNSYIEINNNQVDLLYKDKLKDIIQEEFKNKKDKQLQLQLKQQIKRQKLLDIPKLEDANFAGDKNKSHKCRLILTEGDSAKALAMTGLTVIKQDYYGVFPLKGKVMNVRNVSNDKIIQNQELINLIKILGIDIQQKKQQLRYGGIIIMTDQDYDGSHIKGLIINFIQHYVPHILMENKNFIQQFITPIIKVFKGEKEIKSFYTIQEYINWKQNNNQNNYQCKYYKGLATSTSLEAKEYFKDLPNHIKKLEYNDNADRLLEYIFGNQHTDYRKDWLSKYDHNEFINYNRDINIETFINKEFIKFSYYDCQRSIPHIMDGLKPSQRKILYGSMKKFKGQQPAIRVSQLASYISEQTAYHHGEESLSQAIIQMAQTYIGSNNVNYLIPKGQFGTRMQQGKDHGSSRYLYSKINDIVQYIFIEQDNYNLRYNIDDNSFIEPYFFVPIIPTVLINGVQGIGTGWSTLILQYNPLDLIQQIRLLLDNQPATNILPWFKGFKGSVQQVSPNQYVINGKYYIKNNIIFVQDVPIGFGTEYYKKLFNKLIEKNIITAFESVHDDDYIQFKIFSDSLYLQNDSIICQTLELSKFIKTDNMVLFSHCNKITKYNSINDIIYEFYCIRYHYYYLRIQYLIQYNALQRQILINKILFIHQVASKQIDILSLTNEQLIAYLQTNHFNTFEGSYQYLLSITIGQMTQQNMKKLHSQLRDIIDVINKLQKTTIEIEWRNDLDILEKSLLQFYNC